MTIVPIAILFTSLKWHGRPAGEITRKMRVPLIYCNFSHARTYASAIRKKRTVAMMKIRSSIVSPCQKPDR